VQKTPIPKLHAGTPFTVIFGRLIDSSTGRRTASLPGSSAQHKSKAAPVATTRRLKFRCGRKEVDENLGIACCIIRATNDVNPYRERREGA
jgi:hypothetical protein